MCAGERGEKREGTYNGLATFCTHKRVIDRLVGEIVAFDGGADRKLL